MFAALGDIQFEVVGSPEGYESAGAYDFAEQRVIESKPRLQWVGDDLERLKFELMWHSSFTNPAVQLALLRATAAQHLALPLVFGNGGFRGFFVIESIKMKSQQLSAGGAPIAIRVALALKEWIADPQLASGALPIATFSPLGITTASTGIAGSASDGSTPGVSALLSIPSATGTSGPNLEADDVPAAVIVRSAAR
ncbi:phage tail protein [Candidatus Binatus sp.]|uniref:phage tail protein n=1 Tax=Candidatus Binatus sp. TaxID=2811406 RepID=UPI002F94D8A9